MWIWLEYLTAQLFFLFQSKLQRESKLLDCYWRTRMVGRNWRQLLAWHWGPREWEKKKCMINFFLSFWHYRSLLDWLISILYNYRIQYQRLVPILASQSWFYRPTGRPVLCRGCLYLTSRFSNKCILIKFMVIKVIIVKFPSFLQGSFCGLKNLGATCYVNTFIQVSIVYLYLSAK